MGIQKMMTQILGGRLQIRHPKRANGLNNIGLDSTKWHLHLRDASMKNVGVEVPNLAEATRNLSSNCDSDGSKMQGHARLISKS
jgi:hypothetical protein